MRRLPELEKIYESMQQNIQPNDIDKIMKELYQLESGEGLAIGINIDNPKNKNIRGYEPKTIEVMCQVNGDDRQYKVTGLDTLEAEYMTLDELKPLLLDYSNTVDLGVFSHISDPSYKRNNI